MRLIKCLVCIVVVCGVAPAASQAETRQYTVYATDGYVTMSDGTVKYAFGFNDTGVLGEIQLPSPLIWGEVGDEIQITMTNLGFKFRPDLTDPHTIHLHGVHVVPYYDGFPESSFSAPMGQSFTYKFIANREGSFMYHCHVEAVEHVHMGMYGPLVIYDGPEQEIYGKSYSKEYIWMVSEFDSRWHQSMEPGFVPPVIPEVMQTDPPINYAEWVRVNFRPDYWLINGMGFPDTIRAGAELPLITNAPNGSQAGIQNGIFVANGQEAHAGLQQSALLDVATDETVLVRIMHMGYEAHPLHLHGAHFEIIGSDATRRVHLKGEKRRKAREEKYTILIGSGETYDTLVTFPREALCASQALVPTPEASPFPTDTGILYTPDGPWYFPMHCHDDYHVADQGAYPSGMATLVRVVRPDCDDDDDHDSRPVSGDTMDFDM